MAHGRSLLVGLVAFVLVAGGASTATAYRFPCLGRTPSTVPDGPETGAPFGINSLHHMTCKQALDAIVIGSWHPRAQPIGTYRFTTPGFTCRVLRAYPTPAEQFGCYAPGRSFTWDWET